MSPLLSLPPETLEEILLLLDPCDVAAFSAVSRATREFCGENAYLWTTLFLQLFDPPAPWRSAGADQSFPYKASLEARIRARGLINLARGQNQLARVVAAFPPVLSTFVAISQTALGPDSRNVAFLASLFPHTSTALTTQYLSLYSDSKRRGVVAPITRQHAAHFLLLHGPLRLYEAPRRLQALRQVYDLRNYSRDTSFGPYQKDGSGRVDWVLLDAIRMVTDYNLEMAVEREGWGINPDTGIGLEEEIGRGTGQGWADSAPRDVSGGGRDWAGVEKDWCGTYAFLDHEVFEVLNSAQEQAIDDGTLHLADFREAIGDLMTLELKLDAPQATSRDDPDDDPFPRLTFKGTLGPRHAPANSPVPILSMVGAVSRGPAPDYAIRWEYRVHYAGSVQWALEGVQIGEPGSKAGVRGVWTHATRLAAGLTVAEGPCGPFSWWMA